MRIGTGMVEITPQEGIQLGGNVGCYRPAKIVSDPLYARTLVVENNGKKLCLITLDLVAIERIYCDRIRKMVAEKWGFEYDAIMIHPLQIHSAPSLGNFMLTEDIKNIPSEFDWLRGGDERYNSFAVDRIIESVKIASESLQDVKIGVGSGIEGRLAFNRRAVMRDGKVSMPGVWIPQNLPLGNTRICYIEGPMDPEVGVLCFRKDSLNIPVMLVSYTCHPVCVFAKNPCGCIVSADWPGALADELRKRYGGNVLVLNGACGNINPWNPFDPDYMKIDHRFIGRTLAEMVEKVIETMDFKEETVIDWKVKHIKIPIRKVEPKLLDEAREILKQNPDPVWINEEKTRVDFKWFRALSIMNVYLLQQREPEFDYEIQVFRIGNVALVGLPGEMFVEGGLKIKLLSPAFKTYIMHMVNQYVGYIPTMDAFQRGGHEVETTLWSKLVPEALDMIVDTSIKLLKEMFGK